MTTKAAIRWSSPAALRAVLPHQHGCRVDRGRSLHRHLARECGEGSGRRGDVYSGRQGTALTYLWKKNGTSLGATESTYVIQASGRRMRGVTRPT